jgi:hypothetical protein
MSRIGWRISRIETRGEFADVAGALVAVEDLVDGGGVVGLALTIRPF